MLKNIFATEPKELSNEIKFKKYVELEDVNSEHSIAEKTMNKLLFDLRHDTAEDLLCRIAYITRGGHKPDEWTEEEKTLRQQRTKLLDFSNNLTQKEINKIGEDLEELYENEKKDKNRFTSKVNFFPSQIENTSKKELENHHKKDKNYSCIVN